MLADMSIPITTPALLFPAIAILMLGYVNRYLGTASVIRALKKDYDTGYKRVNVVAQLKIPKKIIQLPLPELPEETRQLLTFIAEVNANEIFSNETGVHIHTGINRGSAGQLVNGRTGTSLPGVLPAQRVRRGSGVSRRSSQCKDVRPAGMV